VYSANDHQEAQRPDGTGSLGDSMRPRRWRRRLTAAVLSAVLALLAGELVTRLFYTDEMLNVQFHGFQVYHVTEGYELVPNTEEGNVRINSLGYRDREVSLQRPTGTIRILIVGDSVVFGPGVNLEDTFSKRLEAMLRSERPAPIEVINGGNPDTGLTEIIRIFKKRDMKMKPDVALLCFYMNDSRPPMGFRSEFVRGDPVVRLVKRNPWLRRSMLFSSAYFLYYNSAIRKEVDRLPVSLRPQWTELFQQEKAWKSNPAVLNELIEAAEFDWGAAWRPETWHKVIEQLKGLDELARATPIRMGLVIMPVKVQVYGSVVRDEPQKRLRKIAREMGWPCLDLLPGLIEHTGGEAIFNDHCHYSPHGHELVAKMILEFLKSQELLVAHGGKEE
jgi:lysophospholipase L1-like esterase